MRTKETTVTHADAEGDEIRATLTAGTDDLILLRTDAAGVHFTREQWDAYAASVSALFPGNLRVIGGGSRG